MSPGPFIILLITATRKMGVVKINACARLKMGVVSSCTRASPRKWACFHVSENHMKSAARNQLEIRNHGRNLVRQNSPCRTPRLSLLFFFTYSQNQGPKDHDFHMKRPYSRMRCAFCILWKRLTFRSKILVRR